MTKLGMIALVGGAALMTGAAIVEHDVQQFVEVDMDSGTIEVFDFGADEYCIGQEGEKPKCTPYDGLTTSLRAEFDAHKAEVEDVDALQVVDYGPSTPRLARGFLMSNPI